MNYYNYVSLELDDYILDKDSTIWLAKLSDGTCAHQDDDRPGYEPSSWHRLKQYCYENKLHIENITLKFRSHIEPVGSSEEGYFFIKSLLGSLVYNKKNPTIHYYKFGFIENGEMTVKKWRVPELLFVETEEREIDSETERGIIWNNVENQNRQKQVQVEI